MQVGFDSCEMLRAAFELGFKVDIQQKYCGIVLKWWHLISKNKLFT